MDWAKGLYGLIGAKYPTASLIAIIILGGFVFGTIWLIAAQQYEKDRPGRELTVPAPSQPATSAPQSRTSGSATTKGDNSPALTGDGNKINYGKAPPDSKQR